MIGGVVLIFLAVLVFFADKDYLTRYLTPLFGLHFRWFFSPVALLTGLHMFIGKSAFDLRRGGGLVLFWLSSVSLWGFIAEDYVIKKLFFDVHGPLIQTFDTIPAITLIIGCLAFSLYLLFHVSYRRIFGKMSDATGYVYQKQVNALNTLGDSFREKQQEKKQEKKKQDPMEDRRIKDRNTMLNSTIEQLSTSSSYRDMVPQKLSFFEKIRTNGGLLSKPEYNSPGEHRIPVSSASRSVPIVTKNISPEKTKEPKHFSGNWDYPRSDLLTFHPKGKPLTKEEIELQSAIIERTLLQFKIEVHMAGYQVGPTVTQYRLRPADGSRLNKIEALKKDLTLALKAKNIQSPQFAKHPSRLAMCVGSGIAGDPVVCDLKEMPHLLIAGQTGSGKSVGMNGFLISLLLRNSPAELRMIMIDPKRVELGVYNGIPHLLAPVINHPDKALNALKWSVVEMIRRYDLLQEVRCRNIGEYNAKVSASEKLPAIVIVVDELADLMMSGNKKEVEATIARIAQMARAVGMHLIVATQRPSVDVITGLIKANIPSRISFTVASQVDSRTILDRVGADDLLGKGDMLYSPSGMMEPERVQ